MKNNIVIPVSIFSLLLLCAILFGVSFGIINIPMMKAHAEAIPAPYKESATYKSQYTSTSSRSYLDELCTEKIFSDSEMTQMLNNNASAELLADSLKFIEKLSGNKTSLRLLQSMDVNDAVILGRLREGRVVDITPVIKKIQTAPNQDQLNGALLIAKMKISSTTDISLPLINTPVPQPIPVAPVSPAPAPVAAPATQASPS